MKKYKGIPYIVYHDKKRGYFCGYVRLPDNHPDNKKVDKAMGYTNIDIDCHYGLTFAERITRDNKDKLPQGFNEGAWIGWDYAHWDDKTNYANGKEWTKEEVEQECENVIKQVLNY